VHRAENHSDDIVKIASKCFEDASISVAKKYCGLSLELPFARIPALRSKTMC